MATPRCISLLGSAGEFKALAADEQAVRLETFMSDWFKSEPDTIDVIRWIQRMKSHSAAVGVCVGDLVLGLLREAKAMHDARLTQAPDARASNLVARHHLAPEVRDLASISTAGFSVPESAPACSETPYYKAFP